MGIYIYTVYVTYIIILYYIYMIIYIYDYIYIIIYIYLYTYKQSQGQPPQNGASWPWLGNPRTQWRFSSPGKSLNYRWWIFLPPFFFGWDSNHQSIQVVYGIAWHCFPNITGMVAIFHRKMLNTRVSHSEVPVIFALSRNRSGNIGVLSSSRWPS